MKKYLLLVALSFVLHSDSEARPRQYSGTHPDCNITMPCIGVAAPVYTQPGPTRRGRAARPETINTFGNASFRPDIAVARAVRSGVEILPHPSGCPRRAFCGCGAALHVFGTPVRHLWLARNWYGFPRAAPGPGMAEVTRGGRHVRVIEADLGGGMYQFYDANSGRGLTRRHVGPIVGTVVNPRGGNRYASAM